MNGVIDVPEHDDELDPADRRSQELGRKLRDIRRRKQLSLQNVEAATNGEYKASVLGAYERGERHISVPRLLGLTAYYGVALHEVVEEAKPESYELTVRFDARPRAAESIAARIESTLADVGATEIIVSAA